MNSGGRGGRGRGAGGWGGRRGNNQPWKRGGRGGNWRGRGGSNSQNFMAPPSQTFRRSDYDENDADGQLTQAPQSHGAGLGNNIGKLIQTQLASSEGDCFPGWDLYFPTTAYEESSASVATVKDFIKYFQTWSTQYTASVEKTLRDKFVEIYYR